MMADSTASPPRAHEPASSITSYHAHVYWSSPAERERALALREGISERFVVQLGTIHDRNVGPHTRSMYQVAFSPDVFSELVPWLMLNRQELSVLIHPNTGRARDDHLLHAAWLGPPLALSADTLPNSLEEGGGVSPVVPNTNPRSASGA
jgi:DOPA 4,5-dioxygenase